jgi:hypothetical protein
VVAEAREGVQEWPGGRAENQWAKHTPKHAEEVWTKEVAQVVARVAGMVGVMVAQAAMDYPAAVVEVDHMVT